ncbi:hypothetical protein ACIRD2_23955 [Streptomyces sp. NPDC093595]|uniref:hypothetical protein n=1 Tax=Streptomyces sp. NPDC093595 TaxID=3366045 RepID=UPI00380FB39F
MTFRQFRESEGYAVTDRPTRARADRPGLPPAHAEFTSALDEVARSVGLAQNRIAVKAGIPATTLSGYLCGHRLPKNGESLDRVYTAMEKHAQAKERSLPRSLAEMRKLFELAVRERWEARSGTDTGAGEPSAAAHTLPAPRRTSPRRRLQRRVRMYGARRKAALSAGRAAVPVPPERGDRHRTVGTSTAAPWATEAEEIRSHFAGGRAWDAYQMLRNTASTVPAHEFPGVVSSCREAGLEQAVETLLKTAAEREIRAVLSITAALHQQHQYEDAGVILAAACNSW